MKAEFLEADTLKQIEILKGLGFVVDYNLPLKNGDSFNVRFFGEYSEFNFYERYYVYLFNAKMALNDLIQHIKQDTAEKYRQEIIKVIGEGE